MAENATVLELLLSMVQYHKEYVYKMQAKLLDEANLLKQSAASCEQVLQCKPISAKEQILYQNYLELVQVNDFTQANLLAQKLINSITSAQKPIIVVPKAKSFLDDLAAATVAYGVRVVGGTQNDYTTSSSDDENWD